TFAGKQIPNSPVDMTLSADTSANLDKQTLTVTKLALKGLGLNVAGNINASKIFDKPSFTGDLDIAGFNLRQFATQLNQTLPKTADKKVLSKVALKTGFSGSTSSLSLKDLAIQLDNTKLKGNLSVAHFTQPDIKFEIGIDSINADRYLPPEKKSTKKKAPVTPETAASGAATELPIETLRTLKIKGDLLIGKLIVSNVRLNNVQLSVRAKEGDIRLDPIAADLYEGKYKGAVMLDAKGKIPHLKYNTQLTGVQLEPLLKDYTQQPKGQVVGVANISGQLNASGANVDQLKRTLSGTAKLHVKDGILRGIDVRKTIEQAEVVIENKQIPGNVVQGGETPFEKLTGTLNIKNGVVNNNDLQLISPGFNVRGGVSKVTMLANLNNYKIKYNLKVAVDESRTTRGDKSYNIGGYKIPIKCRGLLTDISSACKPDYGGILKIALKKGLLEKLFDKKETSTQQPTTTTEQPAQETPTKKSGKDLLKDVLEGVIFQ
ncbi:MAG: AsmA family protein, partial [Gammaproteobacteria bacterium]